MHIEADVGFVLVSVANAKSRREVEEEDVRVSDSSRAPPNKRCAVNAEMRGLQSSEVRSSLRTKQGDRSCA